MILVKKRNGEKEEFNIDKIRKCTIPACANTDINHLELESKLSLDLSHNISSSEIQEKLILIAKNNISDTEPDWDIVAGRLMAYHLMRKVWKVTNLELSNLQEHINLLVKQKYYRDDIHKLYSGEQIVELGNYINPDRDYNLRLSQIALLESKYLIKNQKGVLEYPSTADMFNAMILASTETDSKKLEIAKEYYDMLSTYILSLATPFKSNLRIPNGNTGSCFILEVGDSISSLFKGYRDMAFTSQAGGGLGTYWGKIRPAGAYSDNVPKANKINKWLKLVNDIAVSVNQRSQRKGAITTALDWWHLDIIDFIEIKSELNGDLRDKCFDIFPQIVLDDYIVDRYLADEDIYLFDQYEYKNLTGKDITELIEEDLYNAHLEVVSLIEKGKLKHFEKMRAKDLIKKAFWAWVEYGDFYITHKDNLNLSNYMKAVGTAKCANLCVESYSLSKEATKWKTEVINGKEVTNETDGLTHSCSLISVNVANILNDNVLLKRACANAVRMLDTSIDLGEMPLLEAKNSSELLRNIGIGVVGLADWMAYNKVSYDTEEGRDLAEALSERITYYCYEASIELSKEKGSYLGFSQANYDKLFGKTPTQLTEMSKNGFDWVELQQRILKYGIRNMLLIAYAPNTSSGLVQGVTASYLPAHSKNNTQKLGGLIIPVLPKFIKDRFWFYKTKFQYKTEDIIKFTRRLQRWVDTGISMELTINPEMSPNIKSIVDEIMDGFKQKELKAVYYSMTIDAKTYQCEGCAN